MKTRTIATLAASALIAGCATPGYQSYGYYPAQPQYSAPQPAPQYAHYPQYAGAPAPAAAYANGPAPCPEVNGGHIIGGIAGALLGAQIGKGNGRTAAAAVGAVTGALAGGSLGKDPACR